MTTIGNEALQHLLNQQRLLQKQFTSCKLKENEAEDRMAKIKATLEVVKDVPIEREIYRHMGLCFIQSNKNNIQSNFEEDYIEQSAIKARYEPMASTFQSKLATCNKQLKQIEELQQRNN